MKKENFAVSRYTTFQKLLAVVLLVSVFATTFLTTELWLGFSMGKKVKATVNGTVISFLNVPTSIYEVDAGTAKNKITFPHIIGAVVENEGKTKNVYFDAVWECAQLPDDASKTSLHTEYTFVLSSKCVPADLGDGIELPKIKVKSGKYCIKSFMEISADLVSMAVTPDDDVTFPATVEAFIGDDTSTTSVAVKWVSESETVSGGTTKNLPI